MLIRNLSLALVTLAFTLPAFAAGNGKVATNPDAQAIDQACTTEAQTAGCGSEQVGTGLLKCIHAYKMANKKTFQISAACKAAMQKAHQDRGAKSGN